MANYELIPYTITYSHYGNTLSSSSTETVRYGNTPASVPTTTAAGYTFDHWTYNNSNYTSLQIGSHQIYENRTYEAYYNLNSPTVSIDADHTCLVGTDIDIAADLNASASSSASGATTTPTYSVGTHPTGGTTTITNGVFTPDVPGTYEITITGTVTTSDTHVLNSGISDTATATIYVTPSAPSFTLKVSGAANENEATGASDDAFMILQGDTYAFVGTVTTPTSGYTYEWSLDSNFTTLITTDPTDTSTVTFNSSGVGSTASGYAAESALNSTDQAPITLYCRAVCNNQINSGGGQTIYYKVQPLVDEFKYLPYQTIYNAGDRNVSLLAKYNMDTASGYTTELKFSADNNDERSAWSTAATINDEFMKVFGDVIRKYLYPTGPKYFYMYISAQINGNNITSTSPVVHTTVGTKETNVSKPLYFYSNSLELSDYQVMCYYVDSNESNGWGYQIAQDMYKDDSDHDGHTYRVNIPSTVTQVRFALMCQDSAGIFYYGTPTFSNGDFSFSAPQFAGCTSALVTLDASTRVIEVSSYSSITNYGYTQYTLNCTPSAFKTN